MNDKPSNIMLKKVRQEKNRVWDEEYFDIFTFKKKPVSDVYIEKLAEQMRLWADKDDSLRMTDFYDMTGIASDNFDQWRKRSQSLKATHEYALRRIASRREIGALTRKYDANMVCKTLGHYDPIFDKEEEKRISRLKKNEDHTKQVVVVIPEYSKKPQDTDK